MATTDTTTTTGDTATAMDRVTGTTADDRRAMFNKAQDAVTGAVQSAVEAVKANPKTAAAIAAGATAAVAGAAYGATKLATTKSSSTSRASGTTTRKPAAKRSTAKKSTSN
jgi:hypothetical protein